MAVLFDAFEHTETEVDNTNPIRINIALFDRNDMVVTYGDDLEFTGALNADYQIRLNTNTWNSFDFLPSQAFIDRLSTSTLKQVKFVRRTPKKTDLKVNDPRFRGQVVYHVDRLATMIQEGGGGGGSGGGGSGSGAGVHVGEFAPSITLGVNGDTYFQANGDVWEKRNGNWVKVYSLSDQLGSSSWYSGSGAPANSLGVNGDFYFRTDGTVWEKASGTWTLTIDVSGADGADGSVWLSGTGVPATSLGKVGDWYFRTSNSFVYEKTADTTWTFRRNLRGQRGQRGVAGLDGTDGTPGTDGADGQTSYFHVAYADSADGETNFNQAAGIYIGTYVDFTQADSNDHEDYTWRKLEGADGRDGTDGIPGVNGIDGTTHYLHIKYSDDGGTTFTGNGGEDSGAYLGLLVDTTQADSTDVDDYTWSLIKGADGTDGVDGKTWLSGVGAPSNSIGSDGDFYLRRSNSRIYQKASGTWSIIANLSGADGATWHSGSGAPANSLGSNGDWYFRTSNATIYTRAGGSWSLVVDVNGADGDDGSMWHSGSSAPAGSLGKIGDWYFRTSNGFVYEKTAATTWTFRRDITGPQGPQGPRGQQGTPGLDGDGRTTYFHVAYSDSSDGSTNFNHAGGIYIGTYVDFTQADSNDYRDYTWRNFRGAQGVAGTNGIAGVNGADGSTSYLHIKYSNDNGTTFTDNGGEDVGDYLGVYVDFTQADSTDVDDYTWSKIKGEDGADGVDGATWIRGSGVPSTTIGKDGDFYLRTSNRRVYEKSGGTWTIIANLSGTDGATWHSGTGVPANSLGANDDWYFRTSNATIYRKSSGRWSQVIDINGPAGSDGSDGSTWHSGSGVPANSLGDVGDWYFRTSNGYVYEKTAATTWTFRSDITGPQGADGTDGIDGATWFSGTGTPASSLGKDGDFYLRTSNSNVYEKSGGTWSIIANLSGADGATWRSGTGVPANSLGSNGDWYFRTTNATIYRKTSGAWSQVIDINGADGADGADGSEWHSGSGLPANNLGKIGDWYFRTSNGFVYEKTAATTWTFRRDITGPQGNQGPVGPTGPSGSAGRKWFTGAGAAPWNDTSARQSAVRGDMFFRNNFGGRIYEMTGTVASSSGSWVIRNDLHVLAGITSGLNWLFGDGEPDTSLGVVGDRYFDRLEAVAWRKTSGTVWTFVVKLTLPPVSRGPGKFYRAISGSTWSDISAGDATPGDNVIGDVVALFNLSASYIETRTWSGNAWIAYAEAVDGNLLVNGTVVADKIATNAVTAIKIAANSITAAKIQANAITAGKIQANAITSDKIIADAVTATELASDSIRSYHIGVNTIDASFAIAGTLAAQHISADVINAHTIWRADTLGSTGSSNPPRRNGGGPIVVNYSHGGNMDTMPSNPQLPLTGLDLTLYTWLMFFCWDGSNGFSYPLWLRADTVNAGGSTPIANRIIGGCRNRGVMGGIGGRDEYNEVLVSYTTRGFHFAQQVRTVRISHIYGILNPGHMLAPTNINNNDLGGGGTERWNGWQLSGASGDYKAPRVPTSIHSGAYLRVLYFERNSGQVIMGLSTSLTGNRSNVLTDNVRNRFYMVLRSGEHTLALNNVGPYTSGQMIYLWTPRNHVDVITFSRAIQGSNRSCFLEMGSTS